MKYTKNGKTIKCSKSTHIDNDLEGAELAETACINS